MVNLTIPSTNLTKNILLIEWLTWIGEQCSIRSLVEKVYIHLPLLGKMFGFCFVYILMSSFFSA
jgi:hypothetical protein